MTKPIDFIRCEHCKFVINEDALKIEKWSPVEITNEDKYGWQCKKISTAHWADIPCTYQDYLVCMYKDLAT